MCSAAKPLAARFLGVVRQRLAPPKIHLIHFAPLSTVRACYRHGRAHERPKREQVYEVYFAIRSIRISRRIGVGLQVNAIMAADVLARRSRETVRPHRLGESF